MLDILMKQRFETFSSEARKQLGKGDARVYPVTFRDVVTFDITADTEKQFFNGAQANPGLRSQQPYPLQVGQSAPDEYVTGIWGASLICYLDATTTDTSAAEVRKIVNQGQTVVKREAVAGLALANAELYAEVAGAQGAATQNSPGLMLPKKVLEKLIIAPSGSSFQDIRSYFNTTVGASTEDPQLELCLHAWVADTN